MGKRANEEERAAESKEQVEKRIEAAKWGHTASGKAASPMSCKSWEGKGRA